ncbi:hypothetical protein ACFL27_12800 [candidate division CSSED10-310 bacterium]|uniref:LPXTG cell wall anchor domain-containing protein n=1 Tax=candidate division CSSED10-310 bacterium TaxID=2855610 RepID=A0ABV6YXZ0_UNCC1
MSSVKLFAERIAAQCEQKCIISLSHKSYYFSTIGTKISVLKIAYFHHISTQEVNIMSQKASNRKTVFILFCLLVGFVVVSPVYSDFQVNTYTTNAQSRTAASCSDNGDFVVVWHSNGSNYGDLISESIQGQRFASDGSFLDSQFQVNTYTTGDQYYPAVDVDSDGDFVVIWHSYGSNFGDLDESIQGQRSNSDGSFLGSQFQVNTYTTSLQEQPAVCSDSDGDFVVVWDSQGSHYGDTSSWSVQGRQYVQPGAVPTLSNTFTIILLVLLAMLGVMFLINKKDHPGRE